jgi:hypothetical protein
MFHRRHQSEGCGVGAGILLHQHAPGFGRMLQGASGGGTYFYENLTDTLSGGHYKGSIVLL